MRFNLSFLVLIIFSTLTACGGGGDTPTTPTGEQGTEGEARIEARNISQELTQGQTITISLDQIPLPANATTTLKTNPENGTAVLNSNKITYTSNTGYFGTDSFTYDLTQTNQQVDTYTVTLTISKAANIPAAITVEKVASWKGNSKAAYSIIHDDFCSGNFVGDGMVNNWRELSDRGLVAGFGIIVSFCDGSFFGEMRKMADAGMEIINHTYTHPASSGEGLTGGDVDLNQEINQADTELHDAGFDPSYFAFPLDRSNDMILGEVEALGYLGARGGIGRSINGTTMSGTDDLAPFKANFDCFNIHQEGEASCSKSPSDDAVTILNSFLDDAVTGNGWSLRELHGIGGVTAAKPTGDSYGWVSEQEYRDHLDYVKGKVDSGDVWMDIPSNVTRYWASRTYCGAPQVTKTGAIEYVGFPNAPGCTEYSTSLDIIVTALDADTLSASQETNQGETKELAVKALGNKRFLLQGMNPLDGEVLIFKPQ